jgi:hypothetical protein
MRNLVVLAILVSTLPAACASPAPVEPTQPPASTEAPVPASETPAQVALPESSEDLAAIAGVYVVTLTQEALAAAGVPQMLAIGSEGTWQLTLTADGLARIAQVTDIGVRSRAEGPYSLTPGELYFGPDAGDYACTQFGVELGSYRWALSGDQLSLTVVDDACDDRRVLFVAGPLTRAPAE